MEGKAAAKEAAFNDLYSAHADQVFRFVLSQVRNHHLAQDLGADVFVRAFRAWDRAAPEPGRERAWLFAIAKNVVVDDVRRRARWRRLVERVGRTADGESSVEADVFANADVARVVTALASLRPRARIVIGLRITMGSSYAEIGEVLGVSERAAMMATHRALDKLRVELGGGDV